MRDFTLKTYKDLLYALQAQGYAFQPYSEFLKTPQNNAIILRHDVDLLPANSLVFAQMQNQLGIRGSYYFRAVPESWNESVIKKIESLGHEVGYHYECLTTCKGNLDWALDDFKTNLEALRKLVPVETICMHGSPRSKYDSKDLWKSNNYTDFGIIGEPYFDTDFTQVLYLTDTGRRWDGDKVSVRDKVQSSKFEVSGWRFKCTMDIINAANRGDLPDQIMFTFHPQRWTEKSLPWVKELVLQNIKNVIKFYLIKTRTRK